MVPNIRNDRFRKFNIWAQNGPVSKNSVLKKIVKKILEKHKGDSLNESKTDVTIKWSAKKWKTFETTTLPRFHCQNLPYT